MWVYGCAVHICVPPVQVVKGLNYLWSLKVMHRGKRFKFVFGWYVTRMKGKEVELCDVSL